MNQNKIRPSPSLTKVVHKSKHSLRLRVAWQTCAQPPVPQWPQPHSRSQTWWKLLPPHQPLNLTTRTGNPLSCTLCPWRPLWGFPCAWQLFWSCCWSAYSAVKCFEVPSFLWCWMLRLFHQHSVLLHPSHPVLYNRCCRLGQETVSEGNGQIDSRRSSWSWSFSQGKFLYLWKFLLSFEVLIVNSYHSFSLLICV